VILRVFFTLLITLSFVAILLLPKTSLISQNKLKVLSTSDIQNQIEPADPLKIYPVPTKNEGFQEPPPVSARSAIIIDAKNGTVLYEKDPNIRHLPASTTKLMTAVVALENCSPETIVTVGSIESEGTQMGLAIGDNIKVENLLYGLLLASGNDAAHVLASSCSDSYNHFISLMNVKAKELEMVNTHFMNPTGFDHEFQYSTAKDLAKLAKVAVADPLISKIVATRRTVVTDVTGTKTYYLENINKLLDTVNGTEGVKTGHTEGALEILISKTTRDNNSIIVAVLGSKDRFEESKQLIEWTFKNYHWVSVK
jgi:D-alanyl-D-alanine carboxypeptidase (penicillin-binding protein 5/6)